MREAQWRSEELVADKPRFPQGSGPRGRRRVAAALRGERPDAVPVLLHNFMHAAREAGVPMKKHKAKLDQIAAQTILQAFLNELPGAET